MKSYSEHSTDKILKPQKQCLCPSNPPNTHTPCLMTGSATLATTPPSRRKCMSPRRMSTLILTTSPRIKDRPDTSTTRFRPFKIARFSVEKKIPELFRQLEKLDQLVLLGIFGKTPKTKFAFSDISNIIRRVGLHSCMCTVTNPSVNCLSPTTTPTLTSGLDDPGGSEAKRLSSERTISQDL